MQPLIIEDVDDYYKKANEILGWFRKERNNFKYYKVSEDMGTGGIERIILNDSIEIAIMEMDLVKDLSFKFKILKGGFEICYCAEGTMIYGGNSKQNSIIINKGDVVCWKNQIDESWVKYPKNKKWKSIAIYFNDNFLKQLSRNINIFNELTFNQLIQEKTMKVILPQITVAFLQIANCKCKCNSTSRLLYLQSKAIEIISLLIEDRYVQMSESSSSVKYFDIVDIKKIRQAKLIIEKNILTPLSIEQLSKTIGLNTFKLKVGFKEIYGTTIFGYLRDIRMEKAREYLLREDIKIIDVANRVGYSNPSHFASAFKKKYGVNPSEYRHEI